MNTYVIASTLVFIAAAVVWAKDSALNAVIKILLTLLAIAGCGYTWEILHK